ncbi:VOC family protein [Nocardiopsis gilva YIM 90087]|uniref:VOC family protein n=1 Tax=Nocardiopsis gilva YIM 90087 TaxID=1235441 RepID=A0A223S264_9ACTN|nr:VOC family protein [Nocardiopsis gilva]ASU82109.1 VOC family protein [Nocardiopsis gilva YIM 90087]
MAHLGLVTIVVREYDEAIDFYVGKLGFELVEDTRLDDDYEGKRWVVVAPRTTECANAAEAGRPTSAPPHAGLLLARAVTPEQRARIGDQTGGRVGLFLYTDDFDADHARMRAAGVDFAEEPRHERYGTVAVFRDLYGNRWDLIQRRDEG